ncbi:DJ-1/PfpI family protein [Nonlabens ulvanivorans]|uniref:DJ-1/PfpI family protein n=1 Tax=Nonlabens ulvanivorans TaxID=906888 RepID=UPI002943ED9B|nr:DJ-1/PfpI family protein [Nonlabens ulvanivorans]WOI23906.1 DJ-1/PfpI family protein [Nonlabens ulvanivorans]
MPKLFITLLCFFILISCQQEQKPVLTTTSSTQHKAPTLLKDAYNVGFLVMDGTFNTELTAPFDIFQHTRFRESVKPMNTFTVAQSKNIITTFEGLRLQPDYDFNDAPRIDILVIPSAEHHLDSDLENTEVINWIKQTGSAATYITSHCDGAFMLAQAGILDHVVSTTFPSDVHKMRERFPNLDIRENVWFVHDGKVITSAGGARSFEAAMYLCDVLYGPDVTNDLAGGLVLEYNLADYPHLIINQKKGN